MIYMVIMGLVVWSVLGVWGFVYWFAKDFDLEVMDLFYGIFISVIGGLLIGLLSILI